MPRDVRSRLRVRSTIAVISSFILAGLVLGWFQIPIVSSHGMILRSQLMEGKIPRHPDDEAWDKIPPMTLPLSGQVFTRPVWPEPTARALIVRSVHNGTDISFMFEWRDNTKNDKVTPGTFRDGMALGLPLGDAPAFFCMGQLDHYINIWHWKADWQSDVDRRAARAKQQRRKGSRIRRFEVIPRRASSVEDLIGGGFSTLTSKRRQGRVQGRAIWKRGVWQVVMTRSLVSKDEENEARLEPGRLQAIAFAVWNGENQERNGQKAVAPWFQLAIDTVEKS